MQIEPLTPERIEEAVAFITSVFPRDTDHVRKTFQAFKNGKSDSQWEEWRLTALEFWTVSAEDHLIGIIGLYIREKEPEVCWLSWFCVDPAYRKQGIGTMLFDKVVQEARRHQKRFLRLYTSTAPEEADAQRFYEQRGFRETSREPEPHSPYERIYQELALS